MIRAHKREMKIKMINLGNRGDMILMTAITKFSFISDTDYPAWKYFLSKISLSISLFSFLFFFFKIVPSLHQHEQYFLYTFHPVLHSCGSLHTTSHRISKISIHSSYPDLKKQCRLSRRNCRNGWCELSTIESVDSPVHFESIALCSLINIDYTAAIVIVISSKLCRIGSIVPILNLMTVWLRINYVSTLRRHQRLSVERHGRSSWQLVSYPDR